MRETGRSLGVPVHVFGNETHMTAIVAMALGKRPILSEPEAAQHTANFLLPGGQQTEIVSRRWGAGDIIVAYRCYGEGLGIVSVCGVAGCFAVLSADGVHIRVPCSHQRS